jgi:hypothetical protein
MEFKLNKKLFKIFKKIFINHLPAWGMRITFALFFASILGGLPVYIHKEYNDLKKLEHELKEIKSLNRKLFVQLEDSSTQLKSLKSKDGFEKVMREMGYSPKGSKVYQIKYTAGL